MSIDITKKKQLQEQLLEVLKDSEKYWFIVREGMYGIAGYITLSFRKMYIELLFSQEENTFPFQIFCPTNKIIDLRPIYNHFENVTSIEPIQVIDFIQKEIQTQNSQIMDTFQQQLTNLGKRYVILKEDLNSLAFTIKFFFKYSPILIQFNFQKYPQKPYITLLNHKTSTWKFWEKEENPYHGFSKEIQSCVEASIINWKDTNPLDITDLVMTLENQIGNILGEPDSKARWQNMIFRVNELKIGAEISNINFFLKRSETLGIFCENITYVNLLFGVLSRQNESYIGKINIFGTELSNQEKQSIWLNYVFSQKDLKKSIGAFLRANWYQNPNILLKKAINTIGLTNNLQKKLKECSPFDQFKIRLVLALSRKPDLIMFSISENMLGRMDQEYFIRIIDKVQKEFNCCLVFHGSSSLIEKCDKILTISATGRGERTGSLEELAAQMPTQGQIITIELSFPEESQISSLLNQPNIDVMTIREGEKYNIFSQIPSHQLIHMLLDIFGAHLYNFKINPPTLGTYLEFMQNQQIQSKSNM